MASPETTDQEQAGRRTSTKQGASSFGRDDSDANRNDRPEPPWLTMLYMAGDNNLTEEMVLALQDLVAEGAPPGSAIKAQFDPSGEGFDTQRYTFNSERQPPSRVTVTRPLPAERSTPAVRRRSSISFNGRRRASYSAMRYALVLSGHGGGTSDDFLMRDENSRDALSMKELQEALAKAADIRQSSGDPNRKLDILGFDACFMSMGEVALEVRDYADILVGAEGMEPAFGWPYRRLIAKAKERAGGVNGHPTPENLAREIVEEYVTHYNDFDRTAGRSADLAAIDLRKLDDLVTSFQALVKKLNGLEKRGHNQLLLAHWYTQTYKFDQYADLKDLCLRIIEHLPEYSASARR